MREKLMVPTAGGKYGWDSPIERPGGVTHAERFLKRLGDRSFLSLWCHSGIYRDQGKSGPTGHGKEVCDLLVVFENHILIFSDKDCKYPDTGDDALDWCRWYRRSIDAAACQVYGAEKWIRQFPDRLFLDRACTHRFPIPLSPAEEMKVHRIVVAHGAAEACRRAMGGGSGSLLVGPLVAGEGHYKSIDGKPVVPFAVGWIDRRRGYVHVFDDATIGIVMTTRDTITDFVDYLTKKEALIESDRLVSAAGEEDLLAYFLGKTNDEGEHDFVFPDGCDRFVIDQGFWEDFRRSPERLAQLQADSVSYLWDRLIEKFTHHFITRTSHYSSHSSYAVQEETLRIFAREPRVRRRMLAKALLGIVEKSAKEGQVDRATRVVTPTRRGDPHYVFMALKRPVGVGYDEYREVRRTLLGHLCATVKLHHPDALDVAGIATELGPLDMRGRTEDAIRLDARDWTDHDYEKAREIQAELELLVDLKKFHVNEREYPTRLVKRPPMSLRNSACGCGSGRKFKRCCGRS